MKLILKSISVFAFVFALHYIFTISNPKIGIATHQWQDNVVKAEEYIYSPSDTVLLGTSLSARILYKDSLPSIKSLAFGGSSPECGLTIIDHMLTKPKVIMIETNMLTQESDLRFVEDATNPIRIQMCTLFPNLREKNKPICELFGWLLKISGINMYASSINVPKTLLKSRVERLISSWHEFNENFYKERLEDIACQVTNIEKRGVSVVFFEMPVNPEIQSLPEYQQTQRLIRERFPKSKYNYLPNDTTSYETTDGQHLSYTEQCRYTSFFKKCLYVDHNNLQ